MKKYHLIIIGGGSGGLVAAEFAAKLGVRVALIEAQQDLGGECLHTGCVPSKALIYAARSYWAAGHSESVGVLAKPQLDFQQLKRHIAASIQTITDNHDNDSYYQQLGVEVIHGEAVFIDKHTLEVEGQQLRAKRIVIATGSQAAVPDIAGLTDSSFLTNENVFELNTLPQSLVVIGGGPIGCELGQAFAILGSQVTILQSAPRLLPRDEASASSRLLASLQTMGVTVRLNARIEHVAYVKDSVRVRLARGEESQASKLLVATGRKATMPQGLAKAGVKTTDRGIAVNNRLQTSNKHIYAIGDCNGGMQFTHAAGQQAVVAVQNALLGLRKSFDAGIIPWTTFTTPEIAHIGMLKTELDEQHLTYEVIRIDYHDIDKAITESEDGFIEVLLGQKSRIFGATVIGANAAEILGQIVAAQSWNNFKGIVQAYPTYAGGLRQGAANRNLEELLGGNSGRLLRGYVKLRGR